MNTTELDTNQEPEEVNCKARKYFDKLSQAIKEYKEVGLTACAVLGAVATFLGNYLCDAFYQGYAAGLGVDNRYVQNDNHSLLVSFLIFFSSSLVAVPLTKIIITQMDKNSLSIKSAGVAIFKSIGCIVASFVPIVLVGILCDFQIMPELLAMPTILLAFSVDAFIIYVLQFIMGLLGLKKRRNKKNTQNRDENVEENQPVQSNTETNENPKTETSKGSRKKGFLFGFLIILLVLPFPISYYIGWRTATDKKDFKFIVKNFHCEISSKNPSDFNLILSETDDYYCLSAYKIEEENGIEKITVISDFQTIIPKSELEENVLIIKKHFDDSKILN